MVSPVVFVGGEDIDFLFPSGIVSLGTTGVAINTTAGTFRSGYGRCSISIVQNTSLPTFGRVFQTAVAGFSQSDFWTAARVVPFPVGSQTPGNSSGDVLLQWNDATNIPRLRIRNSVSFRSSSSLATAYPPFPLVVEKLDASGTATQLGSTTGSALSLSALVRLDVHIVYAVAGLLEIYINGSLFFSFSGDTTTNSITSLGAVVFGCATAVSGTASLQWCWSEIAVTTTDSRQIVGIVTQAPSSTGTTDNWTGSASDISEIVLSDVTINYTNTATDIQEYTVTGLPAGVFGVLAVVSKLRAASGVGSPQNIDHVVRTGGSDYFSSNQPLSLGFSLMSYVWDVNPGTSVAWTQADIAAGTFNWGFRAVT